MQLLRLSFMMSQVPIHSKRVKSGKYILSNYWTFSCSRGEHWPCSCGEHVSRWRGKHWLVWLELLATEYQGSIQQSYTCTWFWIVWNFKELLGAVVSIKSVRSPALMILIVVFWCLGSRSWTKKLQLTFRYRLWVTKSISKIDKSKRKKPKSFRRV